jgi:hypothetical protein
MILVRINRTWLSHVTDCCGGALEGGGTVRRFGEGHHKGPKSQNLRRAGCLTIEAAMHL